MLEGCAVNVYLYNEDQSPAWQVKARVGEASVTHAYEAATLARLAETREPLLSSGSSLAREHYAHLDVRRTIAWPTCPSCWTSVLIGAIEAISFDRVLETPEREIGRSGERESLLQGGGRSKFVPWLPGFTWSETHFRLPIVD